MHVATATGYIESDGYGKEPPQLIVYLQHLKDILTNLQDDEIDLSDKNGILTVSSTKGYVTELKVHTGRPEVRWALAHVPGKPKPDMQADGFKGIKACGFPLAVQPVLRENKLMLVTDYGVVMRHDVPLSAYPYPRESFLKAITNIAVEKLFMTENGYWAALGGGFRIMVSGHRAGEEVFNIYNVASTPIADFPAARLIQALAAAANLADKSSRVLLDPVNGIIARDSQKQDNRFAIGDTTGWSRFTILPRTAELLADTLVQAKEGGDTIKLERIDAVTMRFTRGPWQVTFKIAV